jgi:hypothetical protein
MNETNVENIKEDRIIKVNKNEPNTTSTYIILFIYKVLFGRDYMFRTIFGGSSSGRKSYSRKLCNM